MYEIAEVDGVANQDLITAFNALVPKVFPLLKQKHFENGYWWFAYYDGEPVAFAGLVPFDPLAGLVGYFKRCYVMPDHRGGGHGLQLRFMVTREHKARDLGWKYIFSDCAGNNRHSAANFRRAGFEMTEPEQEWAAPGSLYWFKNIS